MVVGSASGGGNIGAPVGAPLPTPDVTDATPIGMSARGGEVALVGYDGANFFEGTGPAPAGRNTAAVPRFAGGCTDPDDNAADFSAGAPGPRNTATAPNPCPANRPVAAGGWGIVPARGSNGFWSQRLLVPGPEP